MKTKKKLSKALIEFSEKPLREIIAIQKETLDNNVRQLENGRTISISQLPDCQHKVRLENIVMNSKEAKIVVIAFLNFDNTWQAYAGYPDIRDLKPIIQDYSFDVAWFCENIRDREQVLMMGDKLPKDAACILFPDWNEKTYKEINSPALLTSFVYVNARVSNERTNDE